MVHSEPYPAAPANQHRTGPDARRARIEELERTAEELRSTCADQRERLAELTATVRSFPGRWFRVGPDGAIVASGGRLPEGLCLGVSPECLRGSKLNEVLPAEGARQFIWALRRAEESGAAVEFDYTVSAAGKERHYGAQLVPTQPERPTLFVHPARDFESRRAAGGAPPPPAWCARDPDHPGVCAGSVVHDVNNLLNSVLCNANLALERMSVSAPARALVERIERAAGRAGELTSEVLACSGKGRIAKEPIDLSQLVEETARLLESALSRHVVVERCLSGALPPVNGDAAQLRRVVMNLITNASEALDDGGGDIALRTGVQETPAELLSGDGSGARLPADHYVYVEVADTGCGMDEATRAAIFEPFYTTKSGGHGLGLAAALAIVRQHQGVLEVDSAPGQGSTLRMVLPAATPGGPPPV